MTDSNSSLTAARSATMRADQERAHSDGIAITPPLFEIAFGIAGLSGSWRLSGQHWTSVAADALAAVSAVLALVLTVPWLTQLLRRESDLPSDLRDPGRGPFVPVIAITPMLLAATLLGPADDLARTLLAAFAVLTLVGVVAVVTAWIVSRLPLNGYHPGFYLPTAGGTLLAAQCVTDLGWTVLAHTLFFVGLTSWLILGAITSWRLIRTPLPPALRPVVFIELAAPALAANTYLVVFNRYDWCELALTAVTILMSLVQVALIPYYRRAPFGVAFWAAAFSYATAASLAMRWISHEHPAGAAVWRGLTLTLATGVVVLLSAATVRTVRRGQFFTRRGSLLATGPGGGGA